MERKNAWTGYDAQELAKVEEFARAYRTFLDGGKTERECVAEAVALCRAAGFIDLAEAAKNGQKLRAGDRVYMNWMNKSFVAFIIGRQPMEAGMNILGAHIDSPRLDVKQNPLYEDSGIAYMDTHYYGGVKKYQWVATPLALHGVVVRKDGSTVNVAIGEDENDPVFYITDLLPHLAQEQMAKNGAKIIEGEMLDIVVGTQPVAGEEKEAVKAGVLAILKEKYGVEEEDFLSAELEAVPAGKSRDGGFDRALLIAYGHDDRVCAYPSLRAVMDFEGVPERTLCAVLTDKEEIGSVGATGMQSRYFENIVAELLCCTDACTDIAMRRTMAHSRMLSSDVSVAYDPNFKGVFEKKNTAFVGRGVCFNKYVGRGGKSGCNDANAEFMAKVRRIMDDAGVAFQTGEIGRVDAGGGGTIAYMCAKYGMEVIDCGVAVLSMHALYEAISKADLYEAYKGYCAFLKNA